MNVEEIENKLAKLKELYTFDMDKRKVEAWEDSLRDKLVQKKAIKVDGIKDLIAQMANKINGITYILAWGSKDLTKEQIEGYIRERRVYLWLLSFFADPTKFLNKLEAEVEKELKNLES